MADPFTDEEPVSVIRANRFYYGASDRRRLIAALRASRAEVERLREENDQLRRGDHFPTLVVPAAGFFYQAPLGEPLLLIPHTGVTH